MKELPPELIAALIEKDDEQKSTRTKPISQVCDECGGKLKNGYCRNDLCKVDAPVRTFPCEYCGHCQSPFRCVWSVDCPRCNAGAREQCKTPTGGLEGLHVERWKLVGSYYLHS